MKLKDEHLTILKAANILPTWAIVECYPRVHRYSWETPCNGGVFAYQLMNDKGRNVATWIPDLDKFPEHSSFIIHENGGRVWDLPIPEREEINY